MLKRIVFFLFAFTAIANAQVRPGVKLGYNLGGVFGKIPENVPRNHYTHGHPDNFKIMSGFQVGMIADCPINDAFAIQPGVRFAMNVFTDEYSSGAPSGASVIRRFSFFYLQVPVYAQYRWNVYEETNVLFQAGPYAGLGLFGRQSIHRNGRSIDLNDGQRKIEFNEDFNRMFDYGISFGVGIEYNRFQLVMAYDLGLSQNNFHKRDAHSGSYNVDLRNHNFSVTLAVIFGRRDPLQSQRDW